MLWSKPSIFLEVSQQYHCVVDRLVIHLSNHLSIYLYVMSAIDASAIEKIRALQVVAMVSLRIGEDWMVMLDIPMHHA